MADKLDQMPGLAQRIVDINDPRIGAYRQLKERELAREGGRFIAEGEHCVRRLLESGFEVESVLLAARRAAEIAPTVRKGVAVYVAPDPLVHEIIGFKFHAGVIACGVRPALPGRRVEDVAPLLSASTPLPAAVTLLVCPEIANTENLGAIIRVAAAFGVSGLVLGENSCDPFFRQAIRVSMGTVFRLPIVRSDDLMRDLRWMKQEGGMELVASVLDPAAQRLEKARRSSRMALLLGNEAQGLDRKWVEVCDRRVTIPMELGTDSLNVAVAAGVLLYHFTRVT